MKPIARSVIALALATSWTPFNLRAQQSETELLKQVRVTKHQAKKIALSRVRHGAIKCVELQKENGVLMCTIYIATTAPHKPLWKFGSNTLLQSNIIVVEVPITE